MTDTRKPCDCERNEFDCLARIDRWSNGQQLAVDELADHLGTRMQAVIRRALPQHLKQHALECYQDCWGHLIDHYPRKFARSAEATIAKLRSHASGDSPQERSGRSEPEEAADPGLVQQAESLRNCILQALSEEPAETNLMFFMKCSCCAPSIASIAKCIGKSPRTVFLQWDELVLTLRKQCTDIPMTRRELTRLARVSFGTQHPLNGYAGFDRQGQRAANRHIEQFLAKASREQQLAFYMRYSPLGLDSPMIAQHIDAAETDVQGWLDQLHTQVNQSFDLSDRQSDHTQSSADQGPKLPDCLKKLQETDADRRDRQAAIARIETMGEAAHSAVAVLTDTALDTRGNSWVRAAAAKALGEITPAAEAAEVAAKLESSLSFRLIHQYYQGSDRSWFCHWLSSVVGNFARRWRKLRAQSPGGEDHDRFAVDGSD